MFRSVRESIPQIIGGVAVTAILGISAVVFPGGWAAAGSFIADVAVISWEWTVAPAQVPTGLLVIMAICTAATVAVPAVLLYASRASKPGPVFPTSDEVLGIVWRWPAESYGSFQPLASFCPNCDYQMQPRCAPPWVDYEETTYLCDHCKWKSKKFDISPKEVESRVRRELQRKARQEAREAEGQ
jgi:hypothetical protein